MTTNPPKAVPDDEVDLDVSHGSNPLQQRPGSPQQASSPPGVSGPPQSSGPTNPGPASFKPIDGVPTVGQAPPAPRKREKIILDHKRREHNTPIDWVIFIIYVLCVYGFLVLMIYLLLLATASNSQATGICYFSIFIFFVIALITFVQIMQRKQKQAAEREKNAGDMVAIIPPGNQTDRVDSIS